MYSLGDMPVAVLQHRGDAIVHDAARSAVGTVVCEDSVPVVERVQPVPLRGNPDDGIFRVGPYFVEVVGDDAARFGGAAAGESLYPVAVIQAQSAGGCQPDAPQPVLCRVHDTVASQSLAGGKGAPFRLGRGRPEQGRKNERTEKVELFSHSGCLVLWLLLIQFRLPEAMPRAVRVRFPSSVPRFPPQSDGLCSPVCSRP